MTLLMIKVIYMLERLISMIIRGIISTINDSSNIRIIMPSIDSNLSYNLELAHHIDINTLNIGDKVIAAFYTETDGVIIAKCQ